MSFLFFVDYLVFVTANQLLALFFDLFRETFHILRIQWRHPAMRELSGRGGGGHSQGSTPYVIQKRCQSFLPEQPSIIM